MGCKTQPDKPVKYVISMLSKDFEGFGVIFQSSIKIYIVLCKLQQKLIYNVSGTWGSILDWWLQTSVNVYVLGPLSQKLRNSIAWEILKHDCDHLKYKQVKKTTR